MEKGKFSPDSPLNFLTFVVKPRGGEPCYVFQMINCYSVEKMNQLLYFHNIFISFLFHFSRVMTLREHATWVVNVLYNRNGENENQILSGR